MSSIRPILFLFACSFSACSSFGSGDPIEARQEVATLEGFCAELADTVVSSCGLSDLEARQELESDCRRNAGTRNPGGYRPELGEACIVQLEAFDCEHPPLNCEGNLAFRECDDYLDGRTDATCTTP